MRILALSGSLRAASTNTALLRAVRRLAPPEIDVVLFDALAEIPPFNPDIDEIGAPPAVAKLRRAIAEADGLLIASPEYAHGVPGTLKNALDWLVAGDEILNKPITLFNASSRGVHAQAALSEILKTMSASLISEAAFTIPLLGKTAQEISAIVARPEVAEMMRAAIVSFARAIEARQDERA